MGISRDALEHAPEEEPAPVGGLVRPEGLPPEAVVVEAQGAVTFAFEYPILDVPPSDFDDADADGFPGVDDPDDRDPGSRPETREEPCNGLDEDLDGLDECPPDIDRDGAAVDVDCDDLDARRGPEAAEIRCDGLDQNCDGHDLCDSDGDGVVDWDDSAPEDPVVGAHPPEPMEPSL